MEQRVFWSIVTCILCGDAIGGLLFTGVFASINNASQIDVKIEDTQTERLIQMQIRAVKAISKDETFDSEILHESPRVKRTKSLSEFGNARCSRYCIEQLDNSFEDINLFWSFAGSKSEMDHFSLEESPRLKISRHVNKNLTNLDNVCQIYLYLGCNNENIERRENFINHDKTATNSEIIRQSAKSFEESFSDSELSKTLAHKSYLTGYTETKFHVDVNITEIIINVRGNLTRAVLAIPTNRTTRRPGIGMSLARTSDTKGVTIGARNPPAGDWLVKLTGVESSRYTLDVTGYVGASERNNTINEISEANGKSYTLQNGATVMAIEKLNRFNKTEKGNTVSNKTGSIFLIKSDVNKKPRFVFERSAEIINAQTNTDSATVEDLLDASLPSLEAQTMQDIINDSSLSNNSLTSYGRIGTPKNISSRTIFNGRMLALPREEEQKIQTRSSEVASLNEAFDMSVKPFASNNVSMQIVNQNQELSARLAGDNKEDIFGRQKILIEVNPESSLVAVPGRLHTIVFDLTNNCVLSVIYAVRATSSSLRIRSVRPPTVWLYPGQTGSVAVDVIIPPGGAASRQDTANPLTLFVDGTQISEKTVYLYIQDPFNKITDNVRPTIEYSFNSNCAGNLNRDRCEKTLWSVDIIVRDPDSGLKSVTAIPNRIYPRTEFISGTRNRVTFYYLSNCCSTTATITAIDVLNNQYSRQLDVTEWDNLSQGEIAAIVVGALLLLLLLILLIIAIVYCVRKRSSHDLPYTQRYGSRPPARSERTSF